MLLLRKVFLLSLLSLSLSLSPIYYIILHYIVLYVTLYCVICLYVICYIYIYILYRSMFFVVSLCFSFLLFTKIISRIEENIPNSTELF